MLAWKTGAVFALLEPEPKNWTENEHFGLTWKTLKHDTGEILLEIEVNPHQEDVFVIDRGKGIGRIT